MQNPKPAVTSALVMAIYFAALIYGRDAAPPGLNNDVAEEALRGLLLADSGRFEVITFSIGNSAETLYLYLIAAVTRFFGTTTLAIQLLSWACALGCIWLTARLGRAIGPSIPVWLTLLAGATSLWMFHYARTGLRAIAAPLFLAAFALLLDRAERREGDRVAGLIAGAVLGLSLYAYTSARVLPIAFLAYALWRIMRDPVRRAGLARGYGMIAAGAAVVSIPNLIFFLRRPVEFLTRGSYTLRGSAVDQGFNVFWSALFPLYYPDYYRDIAGPTFFFDGVSAALTASARDPIKLVFAIALLAGVWQARKLLRRPVAGYLLAVWITSTLLLGLGGPSLTRMLIVWPIFMILIAAGFAVSLTRYPGLRMAVAGAMVLVGLIDFSLYLTRFSDSRAAQHFYGPASTPLGVAAARLAGHGQRVVCVLRKDKGIVDYLSWESRARVQVVEFNQRPLDPAAVQEFDADVLLIEKAAPFAAYISSFPAESRARSDEPFETVRLRVK